MSSVGCDLPRHTQLLELEPNFRNWRGQPPDQSLESNPSKPCCQGPGLKLSSIHASQKCCRDRLQGYKYQVPHFSEAIMAEKKVDPATGEAYTLKAPVGTVSCKP